MHGILLGYEVRFAKDDWSTLTWISKRLGPEIHHILLDELAPNTWYWVVICARTSKGCGKEYFDLVQTWEDGEFSFGGSESVVRMLHVFQRRHLKKKINS